MWDEALMFIALLAAMAVGAYYTVLFWVATMVLR